MSYNRGGMRRDGGRSNDFGGGGNRRSGGGGYRNSYDNYNSPMNPWEGGMVPGRGGGNSGLLPAPGQGDLLSQLTSPEAQLALASNLINKLINQQQSVPSLLSLGNMGSGDNMSSFRPNDGYGNTRNFQDRRRGRMDQLNRRTEPYNKSGMNRRMGTDRMANDRMGDRRNLGKNRQPNFDRKTSLSKSPKLQKEDQKDKKDKDAEKTNGEIKTESADESKREDGKDESKEEEKKRSPIPAALLYCHVCSKNMWDEISFTKHLKGRPHQHMMDGLNEKYKLKVDLLRHEMRLAEQQREMELERRQRQGAKVFQHPREYCAMCDLHFYGHLISHRKNIRHQKLKAFLHPKCSHCNKEFSTRLEWDDHRLTFSHLQEVAEFRRTNKPNIKDDEFDIDELVNPDNVNCGEMVSKEIPVMMGHISEDDIIGEMKEEFIKDAEENKKEKGDEEKADESITEEGKDKEENKEAKAPQGIDIDPSKLPKYNSSVVIGKDLVIPVAGFMCRVCNRFMQGDDEAQVHCRTLSHYTNYCNIVRTKARVTGRKKRVQGKQSKDEKNEDEKENDNDEKNEDEKAAADDGIAADKDTVEDDEGNWKRRKTNESTEEEKMEVDVKTELKEEIPDSVWEEVDKDIDEACAEIQKITEEEEEEVKEEPETQKTSAPKTGRGARRGGRRGK